MKSSKIQAKAKKKLITIKYSDVSKMSKKSIGGGMCMFEQQRLRSNIEINCFADKSVNSWNSFCENECNLFQKCSKANQWTNMKMSDLNVGISVVTISLMLLVMLSTECFA